MCWENLNVIASREGAGVGVGVCERDRRLWIPIQFIRHCWYVYKHGVIFSCLPLLSEWVDDDHVVINKSMQSPCVIFTKPGSFASLSPAVARST